MARSVPEFYLVSADTNPIIGPRTCYIEQRLRPIPEDEYLLTFEYVLCRIEPRLHWETPIGTIDTDELVLAQRHLAPMGLQPIYPTATWPVIVNGGQILNQDIKNTGKASAQDLRHILIGELWPTLEEAERSLNKHLGPYRREPWI